MSTKPLVNLIEHELAGFPANEKEELAEKIIGYLRQLRMLREALAIGEVDIAHRRVRSLDDLDETTAILRCQHAD